MLQALVTAHRFLHRCDRRDGSATRHDAGASLVEYALLVALIAVVCVAAVTFFGGQTSQTFSNVGKSVLDS